MRLLWPALLGGCALISPGCGRSGPPAATHPNVRVLDCSCEAVWPALLRLIEKTGFRMVAKDDAGRIATFMWLGSQLPMAPDSDYDRESLAIAPDGSAKKSSDLRVESAVLMLQPRRSGCEAKITISYQARQGLWGGRWSKTNSSGLLESRFLAAVRLPARSGRPAASEPTRTAQRLPLPRGGGVPSDAENAASDGGRTAVYEIGRH